MIKKAHNGDTEPAGCRDNHHTIMTTKQIKLTPADIEAAIASEHFFTAQQGAVGAALATGSAASDGTHNPLNLLTFCVLVLRNGAKVAGINYGAIDPTGHDPAKGRALARLDAVGKVWELEGYALRERLAAPPNPAEAIAREFIAENRVSCPEATINDKVYENAPELVEKLAGVVGFYRHPEDDA